jgi:hypothetical protein
VRDETADPCRARPNMVDEVPAEDQGGPLS